MEFREPATADRRRFSKWQSFDRRRAWFLKHGNVRRAKNILLAARDYHRGAETSRAFPIALKVDISPLCNLRCAFCVHGEGGGGSQFGKQQRMSLDQFRLLVDRCEGKVSAFSLYYLGDPLTHPDLLAMARMARDAGIYTHAGSNFSFRLSDEKIEAIVTSGLDHFKASLDGLTQQTYEMTRLGGRVDFILSNLERLVAARDRLGSDMTIEVQYLVHDGNRFERDALIARMRKLGIDQLTMYSPARYTMDSMNPRHFEFADFAPDRWPQNCYWPWLFMTVKYNGDVIPCCSHRQSEQYDPGIEDYRVMGNLFEQDMMSVWNGPAYRANRRLVAQRGKAFEQKSAAEHFCYGCSKVCRMEPREGHVGHRDAPVLSGQMA